MSLVGQLHTCIIFLNFRPGCIVRAVLRSVGNVAVVAVKVGDLGMLQCLQKVVSTDLPVIHGAMYTSTAMSSSR